MNMRVAFQPVIVFCKICLTISYDNQIELIICLYNWLILFNHAPDSNRDRIMNCVL